MNYPTRIRRLVGAAVILAVGWNAAPTSAQPLPSSRPPLAVDVNRANAWHHGANGGVFRAATTVHGELFMSSDEATQQPPSSSLVQTISWDGFTWTNLYPSNSIAINGSGALAVVTGDSSVAFFGGAVHPTSSSIQTASAAWAEATFIDTGTAPGPQIHMLYF
jgi:hypothetical protein